MYATNLACPVVVTLLDDEELAFILVREHCLLFQILELYLAAKIFVLFFCVVLICCWQHLDPSVLKW